MLFLLGLFMVNLIMLNRLFIGVWSLWFMFERNFDFVLFVLWVLLVEFFVCFFKFVSLVNDCLMVCFIGEKMNVVLIYNRVSVVSYK